MKVTGIIAEYNPLHLGHSYHLAQARALTGADYCIVAMSGDFVQRGEPAVYSKYLRARAALLAGADLVLELPSVFAASGAEDFARCGVALLDGLGVTTALCFGSESGSAARLMELAAYLNREPLDYTQLLKAGLKKGLSWPAARREALSALGIIAAGGGDPDSAAEVSGEPGILDSPNNILGLEYCRALLSLQSTMEPVTISRRGSGYHQENLTDSMASATALRRRLAADPEADLSAYVPEEAWSLCREAAPIFPEDFSGALNYRLLTLAQEGRSLTDFEGVTPELAQRIKGLLPRPFSWSGWVEALKTRQYTYTRLSRCLTHILLNQTASQTALFRENPAPYGRVLGFRRESAPLLSAIKEKSRIPLVTKTADAARFLEGPALTMLQHDFYVSHLWQATDCCKYGGSPNSEFTQPICIL